MDNAAYATFRFACHTGAWSRLRLALAVSLFSHLLFLAALVTEAHRGSARALGAIPFTVRLETLSHVPPAVAAVADPDELPVPRRMDRKEGNSRSDRLTAPQAKASTTIRAPASSLALPPVPDPTVYAARDLDTYPRPLVPLNASRLEDPASGAAVLVRLELIIDEHGIVNHVALAGPGPAGALAEDLREMLAAARFIPASKDGRAVKSRVLLSVSLSPKNGER